MTRQKMTPKPPSTGLHRQIGVWPINGDLTTARYKACGNGVVANVAEWVGCRILDHAQVTA